MSTPDAGWPRATVNERLLIHLREAWIGQPGPPQASTQDGIARALRIRSNHVSRAVAALVRSGLVTQSTERVRGELRKRKVYALTAQGRALADRLHAELCKKEILLLSAGSESRLLVGETLRLPGGPFTLSQVLTALKDGHVLAPTALRSPESVAATVCQKLCREADQRRSQSAARADFPIPLGPTRSRAGTGEANHRSSSAASVRRPRTFSAAGMPASTRTHAATD